MNCSAIRAKKSLGQHFLINQAACRRIVGLLDIGPEDQILEIGPGSGALTREIVSLPCQKLVLLEKDSYWAQEHEKKTKAEVICGDALQFAWAALMGRWKLVGNLPYNVASPLVWDIVAQCAAWKLAVFMLQKEVAERICATPGGRKYGALSVWVQAHARVKMQFCLGPGSFSPPPKVDSAVVSFWPLAQKPAQPKLLKELLAICFQKRRKQLGTIFAAAELTHLRNALRELNIAATARPENLTCEDYVRLSQACEVRNPSLTLAPW